MLRRTSVVFQRLLLLTVLLAAPVYGEEKGWSLREMPLLETVAEQPATEKESKEIRTLIKGLAQIDDPDIGYSPTMSGNTFSPVPALDYWAGWTVAPHNLKRSESLKALVAFGPKALP